MIQCNVFYCGDTRFNWMFLHVCGYNWRQQYGSRLNNVMSYLCLVLVEVNMFGSRLHI